MCGKRIVHDSIVSCTLELNELFDMSQLVGDNVQKRRSNPTSTKWLEALGVGEKRRNDYGFV